MLVYTYSELCTYIYILLFSSHGILSEVLFYPLPSRTSPRLYNINTKFRLKDKSPSFNMRINWNYGQRFEQIHFSSTPQPRIRIAKLLLNKINNINFWKIKFLSIRNICVLENFTQIKFMLIRILRDFLEHCRNLRVQKKLSDENFKISANRSAHVTSFNWTFILNFEEKLHLCQIYFLQLDLKRIVPISP